MEQRTVLFIYSHWQSFVRDDFDLLKNVFKVRRLQFKLKKGFFSFFFYQLKGFLSLLISVPKNDVVYIWFCDYHAFWAVLCAKIFNKKSVIVVGGFDAVKIPSINYGLFMNTGLRQQLAKFAYKNCDKIISVDASLIEGENNYAGSDSVTGVEHFVQGIKYKSDVIPTGYDAGKWTAGSKKNQVLTVALIKDQKVFLRKGIDLYLNVVKNMPDTQFYLVGLQDENLIPEQLRGLKNLKTYPVLPQEELIDLYAKTKVYAQFSVSEGLPNVLCEAMMSGCIPVGTAANGIPLAIGNCGFILNKKSVENATALIQLALNSDESFSDCARNRIQKLFPTEKRRNALIQLIESL